MLKYISKKFTVSDAIWVLLSAAFKPKECFIHKILGYQGKLFSSQYSILSIVRQGFISNILPEPVPSKKGLVMPCCKDFSGKLTKKV